MEVSNSVTSSRCIIIFIVGIRCTMYTDCPPGRTNVVARHVTFVQIICRICDLPSTSFLPKTSALTSVNLLLISVGALKTRDWKTRNRKTRHQIAGVENAGPENGGTSKLWKAVAVENVQHS